MTTFDDWATVQWAGIQHGAAEVGRDFIADVGSAYQAFLMGNAGWRVPPAHDDFTMHIAQDAASAELEQDITSPQMQPSIEPQYG